MSEVTRLMDAYDKASDLPNAGVVILSMLVELAREAQRGLTVDEMTYWATRLESAIEEHQRWEAMA